MAVITVPPTDREATDPSTDDGRLLAADEAAELAECEERIGRGLATFVEVGEALTRVRDGRLYRTSHRTFEAYLRERWDMTKSLHQ